MSLPLLPTSVVGSYSMPGWLERLKTEYVLRRISRQELDEIQDTAVKAAIKDQEVAGVDIITDGELRRDNLDRLLRRTPSRRSDRSRIKEVLLRFLRQRRSRERCRWPVSASSETSSSSPPIPSDCPSSTLPDRTLS